MNGTTSSNTPVFEPLIATAVDAEAGSAFISVKIFPLGPYTLATLYNVPAVRPPMSPETYFIV